MARPKKSTAKKTTTAAEKVAVVSSKETGELPVIPVERTPDPAPDFIVPTEANSRDEALTPKVEKSPTVSNTVVVALNYPLGITFDLSKERRVKLNGNAESLRGKDKGQLPVGAFGLTVIDRADWEEIKAKYGTMRLFRSGLIFVSDSKSNAEAEAEEKKETRHGLEAVDPKKDVQLKGRIVESSAPAE